LTATDENIEEFMLEITETTKYKDVEYLIFSIRKPYLDYMTCGRLQHFAVPGYLKPLVEVVFKRLKDCSINEADIWKYMLQHDFNGWVAYYDCVRGFAAKDFTNGRENKYTELLLHVLTGYILDRFKNKIDNISTIVENEVLTHEPNKYGLSVINGAEFRRDCFIFDGKAYLYNILTNTNPIDLHDDKPGFARIITEKISDGNILMRLDDRLAVPEKEAISYSTVNFEKFYGPQFLFKESILQTPKTITVHIDASTMDKLLLVVKKDYDENKQKEFWHIEIETLPHLEVSSSDYCLTTFLHGMFYPGEDVFTHIDCTRNQYSMDIYQKKYSQSSAQVPIDQYTENGFHYKIWCIENGHYTREVWYDLMKVTLANPYCELLDEILA